MVVPHLAPLAPPTKIIVELALAMPMGTTLEPQA